MGLSAYDALHRPIVGAIRRDVQSVTGWAQPLAASTLSSVLIPYLNWAERIPTRRPRRVHCSDQLRASAATLSPRQSAALESIVHDIRIGADLLPYLSTKVGRFGAVSHPHTPLQHRDELDVMLFGWGVHHLHLHTRPRSRGSRFVRRTDELLLAMFRGADCYLLMIADSHDDGFGNVDVLRIAVRQWPEAKLLERARTIVGLPESPTDRDLVELRDNGVTTLVEIDHNVYLPRGITTAGTSLTATARADRLLHWLQSRPLHDLLEPSRQGAHTVDLQRLRVAAHRGRLWLRLDPSRRVQLL